MNRKTRRNRDIAVLWTPCLCAAFAARDFGAWPVAAALVWVPLLHYLRVLCSTAPAVMAISAKPYREEIALTELSSWRYFEFRIGRAGMIRREALLVVPPLAFLIFIPEHGLISGGPGRREWADCLFFLSVLSFAVATGTAAQLTVTALLLRRCCMCANRERAYGFRLYALPAVGLAAALTAGSVATPLTFMVLESVFGGSGRTSLFILIDSAMLSLVIACGALEFVARPAIRGYLSFDP